jgi:hypothetical protein
MAIKVCLDALIVLMVDWTDYQSPFCSLNACSISATWRWGAQNPAGSPRSNWTAAKVTFPLPRLTQVLPVQLEAERLRGPPYPCRTS